MRRRDWLLGTSAIAASAAYDLSAAPRGRPRRPALKQLPKRIAFGSCAEQDQPQPIWDAINELQPELFIFLGDNIYGDTRDMRVLSAKYRRLDQQPGFRRLCERTAVLATWDDHDYGENDAGSDYPMKAQSQKIFCDFWSEPRNSPRRTRDGIYDSVILSDGNHSLQVILPDLRFNRTPLALSGASGQAEIGPYARQTSPGATMLGEPQWQWLEGTLRERADLRIFASSLQVSAEANGWEAWSNFPADQQRLLDAIRRAGANGLVCISGDMHYGETSCLRQGVPYPLWDITSSGLTEVWHQRPPNKWRVGDILQEPNFGWIEIDWHSSMVDVLLQVRGGNGDVRLEQRVSARQLQVAGV